MIEIMQEHDFHIIRTHGLTKTFGEHRAVNNVDLLVPQGTVYGFLGPNGSGKSTTMKLLLGLMKPTAGEVFINGRKLTKASRPELLGRVGSMIEAPPGYGHLTGWENLQIVQSMLGLEERQIIQALDIVRLTKNKDKLVKNYSLGMKQRLGIAMALAREPELLILDEPTNGLDPAGIEEIRSLIIHLAQQGITIMVSSHLLDEIDKMASVLGIINNGTLISTAAAKSCPASPSPISSSNPTKLAGSKTSRAPACFLPPPSACPTSARTMVPTSSANSTPWAHECSKPIGHRNPSKTSS